MKHIYIAALFVTVSLFAGAAYFATIAQGASVGSSYSYRHYTSSNASSTVRTIVFGGMGELGTLTINKANTNNDAPIRLYDAATTTAATSTLDAIAVIRSTTTEKTMTYDVSFLKGLTVELPASWDGDITIAVR